MSSLDQRQHGFLVSHSIKWRTLFCGSLCDDNDYKHFARPAKPIHSSVIAVLYSVEDIGTFVVKRFADLFEAS